MPIISIINNKGGVSKSTTCVTLADVLGRMKKRVLVFDNDTQSNASSLLLNQTRITNTLYHLVTGKAPIEKCIYRPLSYRNVWCLPNDTEFMPAEELKMSSNLMWYREKIRDYALANFDVCLVDNPPNLGVFCTMSLYMSDAVIVPVEAGSMFSVEGLGNAVDYIQQIRNHSEKLNPDLKFLKLLITKVDKRTNASKNVIAYIHENYPDKHKFSCHIPTAAAIQQAEAMRQTVMKFHPASYAARAYKQIAKELYDLI